MTPKTAATPSNYLWATGSSIAPWRPPAPKEGRAIAHFEKLWFESVNESVAAQLALFAPPTTKQYHAQHNVFIIRYVRPAPIIHIILYLLVLYNTFADEWRPNCTGFSAGKRKNRLRPYKYQRSSSTPVVIRPCGATVYNCSDHPPLVVPV